jgi:hypothetical protein
MTLEERAALRILRPLRRPATLTALTGHLEAGAAAARAQLAIYPGSAALAVTADLLAALYGFVAASPAIPCAAPAAARMLH